MNIISYVHPAQKGFMIAAQAFMTYEQVAQGIAGLLHIVEADLGFPCNTKKIVPGKVAEAAAKVPGILGSIASFGASMSSIQASGVRQQEEWNFQIKTAKEELLQVEKTILSAQIRLAIAEKDLENHDLQIKQSQEVYDYKKNMFTNLELYTWMSNQLMKLHRRAYELAYELAKQAERAMIKELSVDNSIKYIQFDNWDSGNRGLLAGAIFSVQLKELDNAYIKNDKHRFELSKDISLRLLDPQALIDLIITDDKECEFTLDQSLFRKDFNDKILEEITIKSIAVSIPCVTGPQVAINVKIKIADEEIITSSGVNDSGVFEPGFSQPKYMPFEYLKLDNNTKCILTLDKLADFDITTISDVVLHISYFADSSTETNKQEALEDSSSSNLLMSWKHDFPLEWQNYLADNSINVPGLTNDRIPYRLRGLVDANAAPSKYYLNRYANELKLEEQPGGYKLEDIWLLYG